MRTRATAHVWTGHVDVASEWPAGEWMGDPIAHLAWLANVLGAGLDATHMREMNRLSLSDE